MKIVTVLLRSGFPAESFGNGAIERLLRLMLSASRPAFFICRYTDCARASPRARLSEYLEPVRTGRLSVAPAIIKDNDSREVRTCSATLDRSDTAFGRNLVP